MVSTNLYYFLCLALAFERIKNVIEVASRRVSLGTHEANFPQIDAPDNGKTSSSSGFLFPLV
jgi:hypothetical protein